jgi:hypothetical protein
MHSKFPALMLLATLPLAVGAQAGTQGGAILPDPHRSAGAVVADGTEAGRHLQQHQVMEDRRRHRNLGRLEQLELIEQQRETDHQRREGAEQRRQLQRVRAQMEMQRTAAR